jgi:hypothetical protein
VFAGSSNDGHTGSLMGAIADGPRRRHASLVVGLTLATLFAGALGARAFMRARRAPTPPPPLVAAAPPPGAAAPALAPQAAPDDPAAGAANGPAAAAPDQAPAPDETRAAHPSPGRRSKAALARESRERGKRGARAGGPARAGQSGHGAAPVAMARPGKAGSGTGRSAETDAHPPAAGLVASKSALTAAPPAPPPAPLDISRAAVSIGGVTSTSAIPSSNIRSALSRVPLLHCYRDALRAAGAPVAGTAVLHLKIDIAGYVTGTQLDGAQFLPGVKACVEQAARGARIKDVDTGEGSADITLNFAYSP